MEDLLLGLLGELLGLIFEAIFEYMLAAVADLLLRALSEFFGKSRTQNPWLAYIGYGFLGILFGLISLAILPHRLIHAARIPGSSLVISPVLVGLMMWATGAFLRRRNVKTTRLENFAYGFVFAFGLALVRFLFAK
jgi:hypothetical protein